MYNNVNDRILKNLESISGKNAVLTSSDELLSYSEDESGIGRFTPETVIKPSTPAELEEIIKLALMEKIPLTPRGGGTGLSGGALAVKGGILLSFERMNKIKDLDKKNSMAVLEPGVINAVLQEEAEKENLFYPVNPASMDSCTIGGNVAENSGGANTVRYGTTRNYLCGVEAFTGKGQLLRAGGRVLKNATDQILLQLLCGSEGILGIFSQLTLRLLKKPLKTYWIIAPFKNIDDIAPVALKILSHPLLDPTMIEIMDALTLFCAEKFSGESLGFPDYNHLMVRFDGNDPQSVENFASITGEICMDAGAEDVLAAESASEQTRLWKIRSGTHEAIQNVIGSVCEEDVVVPIAAAGAMIIEARKISSDFDLPLAIFGHLGDGNLHINYSRKDPLDESPLPVDKLKDRIFAAATSLGGKISGEHGIGITKSKWFIKHADPVYLSTLKKIKATLDPENIINPGKIIP